MSTHLSLCNMTHYASSGFIINAITMVDFDSSFQRKRTGFAACSSPMTHFTSKHTLRAVFYFLLELVYTGFTLVHQTMMLEAIIGAACHNVAIVTAATFLQQAHQMQASSAQVGHPDQMFVCAARDRLHTAPQRTTTLKTRRLQRPEQ